jgi:hypothetical protein
VPDTISPPWYEVVADQTLRQGDIFLQLPALWLPAGLKPPDPKDKAPLEVNIHYLHADWIILSASCELDRAGQANVLLCRVFSATHENLQTKNEKDLSERLEVIRRGFDPRRFLLAEHPSEPRMPLSFAGYRTQVFLPDDYVRLHCTGPRLRMRPPHRENFGNWAGGNLGRVGIEEADQIRFSGKPPYIGPTQVLRSMESE